MKTVTPGAQPGRSPRKKPMPVPRRIAGKASFRSAQRGKTFVIFSAIATRDCSSPRKTSESAKRPTTSAISSTPLMRGVQPKVKRGSAVDGPRPIRDRK